MEVIGAVMEKLKKSLCSRFKNVAKEVMFWKNFDQFPKPEFDNKIK